MGFGVDITSAAKEAKVSRWTMWRKVRALNEAFPELHILAASKGQKRRVGKYRVNAEAMVQCLSLIAAKNTHLELVEKLDMHEGIFRGLKTRIKRLERRVRRIEGPQNK